MKKTALLSSSLFLAPLFAFAQTSPQSGILGLVNLIGTVINALIPILIGAAIVVFFYGLVMYIWKRKGADYIYIGIIALFVMVSVWGIVRIAQSTLGIGGVQQLPVPHVTPTTVSGS